MTSKESKFSPDYKTYEDWLKSQDVTTQYVKRVIKGHSRFPNATLSQLRGHASKGKKPVSQLKEIPIYKRSWSSLNRGELSTRERSLEVLSKVRRNDLSLTNASRELHTSPKTVVKNTNAFKKLKGKWIAKSQDRISRIMSIYENGKQERIEVRDSRIASKIGKYNNAVKQFLTTGNTEILKEFNKPIKDAKGNLHYFETDPDKLTEIMEAQEEPEFYEIYKI
jgi:hypothetical protein